jgi:3-oxoadipate enol-lactonase
MKTQIGSLTVGYELSGPRGAPVVAFSHSLASSRVMWEPQVKPFERDFQVLRCDTRGHGESGAPEGPYSFDLLAEDFIKLLDALQIDRVHFVGLSMGGMIGQALGMAHADRLLSLSLCDTAPHTSPEAVATWKERIVEVRRDGLEPQLKPTMSRWFTASYLAERPPMLGKIEAQFIATPVEGYIGCAGAIMKLDNLERLEKIRLPTLVVVGEEDPGTPVSAAKAIQERIPGSRLAIIPGARHLPNIEQEALFNRALFGFLGKS